MKIVFMGWTLVALFPNNAFLGTNTELGGWHSDKSEF